MTTVRKRFDKRVSSSVSFTGEKGRSRTKQSFAKEADINNIMKRYDRTGVLVDPSSVNSGRIPSYGDFSGGTEFMDVQNRIAQAHEAFAMLPSDIRTKFQNNVGNCLDFMANPENLEECQELGLVEKAEPTVDEAALAEARAAAEARNAALDRLIAAELEKVPTEPPVEPTE